MRSSLPSNVIAGKVLRQLGVGDHIGRDLLLNGVVSSPLMSNALRSRLLRRMGLRLGPKVQINPRCFFGGTDITVGPGTFINWDCFFDNLGTIEIGAGCNIGMGARFITSHHEVGTSPVGVPISVGDRVWIGGYTIVVPGVTIGDDCVVGAGSVVTHDLEGGGRYAGNPARPVGGRSGVIGSALPPAS